MRRVVGDPSFLRSPGGIICPVYRSNLNLSILLMAGRIAFLQLIRTSVSVIISYPKDAIVFLRKVIEIDYELSDTGYLLETKFST